MYPRRDFYRGVGLMLNGHYEIRTGVEIGEGGLSFDYPEVLPHGALGLVNFQIPGGSFVSIIIEIRGSEQDAKTGLYVVGCSFQNLKFDYKREIRTFVSARA